MPSEVNKKITQEATYSMLDWSLKYFRIASYKGSCEFAFLGILQS